MDDKIYTTTAGAKVSGVPLEIISDADIILKVQPSPMEETLNEVNIAKPGATIVGLLSPHSHSEYIDKAISKNLSTIAMELVPRVTKAQSMDVLSSQSNLAGYRAVIEACYYYDRAFPMMMTAAGTVNPAKVLIIGVGVAGLQAIATAKRLGAVVSAYDVRAATKEQVESLNAKFVYPPAGLVCVLFAVLIVMGNMIYQKFVVLPILPFHTFELSVGAITYPLTFLLTDLIAEFYGKNKANFCVKLALTMNIMVAILIAIMDSLTATEWSKIDDIIFHKVFGLYSTPVRDKDCINI